MAKIRTPKLLREMRVMVKDGRLYRCRRITLSALVDPWTDAKIISTAYDGMFRGQSGASAEVELHDGGTAVLRGVILRRFMRDNGRWVICLAEAGNVR